MVSGTGLSSLFYLSVSRETHFLFSFSSSLELLGPLHSLQPTTCFLYFHHSVEYVLFFCFNIDPETLLFAPSPTDNYNYEVNNEREVKKNVYTSHEPRYMDFPHFSSVGCALSDFFCFLLSLLILVHSLLT